ncbi:MAG: fibronectin type III domain-containing protein [Emergencia sp.]
MKIMKRMLSITIALAMIIACIPFSTVAAAEEDAAQKDYIDITIDGVAYNGVTGGSELIIGDVDPEKADIKILTYNGNALQNVGTKSGVLDDQGRTVLETKIDEIGEGCWQIRFCYHTIDDPNESNKALLEPGQTILFDITGITFKASTNSTVKPVTVKAPAVTNLKAVGAKKALKLTWKSNKCSSYIVEYSVNSNFKNAKSKTVTAKSCTIKNLKAGKKYYVRVRSVVKYTDSLGNKKTVKSAWKKVSCKTK